jgi:PKD domain
MRRYSLIARRMLVALSCSVVASLAVAAGAQAEVLHDQNTGGTTAGVALTPNFRGGGTLPGGVSAVAPGGSCADPAASTEPDILSTGTWPTPPLADGLAEPICWQGGPVMHANETFAVEWEGQSPNNYWPRTTQYIKDFLGDVAGASNQLVNPYSDTTQYWDNHPVDPKVPSSARAAYNSKSGGGCDDNGTATCTLDSVTGSGTGHSLPTPSNCPVSGDNIDGGSYGGGPVSIPNNLCITDSDIETEVTRLVQNDGLIAHTKQGYTPLVTVLTPPGVVVCLDSLGKLCSSNSVLAPPPPVLSTAGTGGTVSAGAYQVVVTYVDTNGTIESAPSAPASIATTGSTSTITIDSPPAHTGEKYWYAYVTGPDGSVYARQTTATYTTGLIPIGQPLTLTAPPIGGQAPPNPATFCSYHSKDPQVLDPQTGQPVSYVVQPWSAFTICDEPDVPTVPPYAAPDVVQKSAGQRLVSPLSQSSMAAIVNPQLNGWFGSDDGLEIDDQNACQPLGHGLDTFNFGSSGEGSYYLQRESNNTTVVNDNPWTYAGCLPSDVLEPSFVVPASINQGDTVELDGSVTASSLAIPNANYSWSFGDGANGTGPSVEHTYNSAGNFTVSLTAMDRGGNSQTFSQVVQVLGASGEPAPPPSGSTGSGGGTGSGLGGGSGSGLGGGSGSGSGGGSGSGSSPALNVRLQLLPQSLKAVLRNGISVQVTSNRPANGIATVSITRASAKKAGIKVGHGPSVRIGLGTVSSIQNGTVTLRLHLSPAMAKKLSHLHHVAMTIRLQLVAAGNQRFAIDAAGRY